MTTRSCLIVAVVLAGVLLSALPSGAEPGVVFHAGSQLWQFRASAGGMSPEARAAAVHLRLVEVMSMMHKLKAETQVCPGCPMAICPRKKMPCKLVSAAPLKPGCATWLVCAKGMPVVTVTPADAEANATSVETLAGIWVGQIARALATATRAN